MILIFAGFSSPHPPAGIAEVHLRECLSQALALFADGAIGRGLGCRPGKPIQHAQPAS
jgi:hypothetical protein